MAPKREKSCLGTKELAGTSQKVNQPQKIRTKRQQKIAGPRKFQSTFDCMVKSVRQQKIAIVMPKASRISAPYPAR